MTFIVRPSTETDAPFLPDIERSAGQAFLAIADLQWLAEDTVCSTQDHLRCIASGTSWVAMDDTGARVGFLIAEVCDHELHIAEMSVRREAQGAGCGRALMMAAIAWAKRRRLAAVTLTTFAKVPWNAPFYSRLGFRRLTAADTSDRLGGLLRREGERGLPGRCAMRLVLADDGER